MEKLETIEKLNIFGRSKPKIMTENQTKYLFIQSQEPPIVHCSYILLKDIIFLTNGHNDMKSKS